MLKFILVGIIVALVYRYWNDTPKIEKTGQESDEFTDYEEID